ncbi:MAG: glycosyltransferase family 4 protein [Cyclobacteriaceae bacterium]
MKVLILHQHFKTPQPGGAIRSYYLARALVESGADVEVITAHDKAYEKKVVEGIAVHYLRVPYRNSYGFIRRAWAFLQFLRKSVSKAGSIKNVDLCYAISVPLTVGLAAIRIKKRYGIPYYFEVGDLWPDAPIQMGFLRNPVLKTYLLKLERGIYGQSEGIVALSPSIKRTIEEKSPDARVALIPNMADTEFFQKVSKSQALETKYELNGKFVVSYIGAIGFANGLDYMLKCAEAARMAAAPVHFFICGEGADFARLKVRTNRLALGNLTFLEFRDREGVRELLSVADAVFVCYKPFKILETGSPNKFFDGLAAGKLIVVNFGGWIKKEIEDHRCGINVDPHDAGDFVRKIRPFITDKMLLQNYQFNARTLAENKYSRNELSHAFCKFITERHLP